MHYSKELQHKIDELGLQKENILYITIKNVFLHEIRKGEKDVEYRDLSEHYIKKLFTTDKSGNYSKTKPITHLLLQGGYNADSPRMLIECNGWVINGKNYPADAGFSNYALCEGCINLILGRIEYDSEANTIFIEKERKPRQPREKVEVKHPDYLKPINLVEVNYAQTGQSKSTNEMGMREMQAKAYEARTAQYLLIKAPPASGKSRALMFIGLDKLYWKFICPDGIG